MDLQQFLIQFWSNTPVKISLVFTLELLLGFLDCCLEHQYIMIPLKKWYSDVTERLLLISFAWSPSKYVSSKLEYYCVWFIYSLSTLNKHWSGISSVLEIFFLEYIICLCWWWMIYYIPCLRSINYGSIGELIYPLKIILGCWRP